ncbi:MlaD family protein [Haloechinothrix salitolerans]|uniref:MlaD family protein n=1 Tax=Haloechinothrix salitolerans TaxID=926830 RepID=A0ABW2C7P2_9PSEU
MLTRKIRVQIIAFFAISVVAVAFALFRFTDIGKVFGEDIYTVSMRLDESGGIFSNAEVTYRGYNIGRVGELSLTEDGLEVELNIEPDTPPIPADLDALVRNRSAIGEQFVDLRPRSDGGPYLEDGAVIPVERTKTPVPTAEVINDLHDLASSVPTDSLRTVVDESFKAFSGTGDDLQLLMDTTRDFTAAARQNLPDTVELLRSGNQVLRTQNAEIDSIRSFSRDLRALSETFKGSDADIRRLIEQTPPAANQISQVVDEIGPGLSALVANLITLGEISDDRLRGLEQTLLTYPALGAGATALLDPKEPKAPLGLAVNLFDPPPCVKGYEGTKKRPGDDTSPSKYNEEAYCAEPKGSPITVRGSQNAPFNGVPVAPTEQQLEENSDRDQESLEEDAPNSLLSSSNAQLVSRLLSMG